MTNDKVYVLVEKFTENVFREERVFDKRVHSVNSTLEGAKKSMKDLHDSIIEDIIEGDENEMSRISTDLITDTWCQIGNDDCSEWFLDIIEMTLDK